MPVTAIVRVNYVHGKTRRHGQLIAFLDDDGKLVAAEANAQGQPAPGQFRDELLKAEHVIDMPNSGGASTTWDIAHAALVAIVKDNGHYLRD